MSFKKPHLPEGDRGDPWGLNSVPPPFLLEHPLQENQSNAKFVQDTSKFWYKPHLSRDQGMKPEMVVCPSHPTSKACLGCLTLVGALVPSVSALG